jgi:hypothetical protein
MNAMRGTIDGLAVEVGRLRRRTEPESSLFHLVGRIAGYVESLDCQTFPSAGELYPEFFSICGDHDVALSEALRVVDTRRDHLRSVLAERVR